jgi:hypothetical protein
VTSGLRHLEEVDEETELDFWCRLWMGEREFLVEGCLAGDSDDEVRSPEVLSMSDAFVGGEEARGDDF